MRLQDEGMYSAKFSGIQVPILMLHGTFDPHPGRMILSSLNSYLPQIEYHEWDQCGHHPWLERAAGEDFFRYSVAGSCGRQDSIQQHNCRARIGCSYVEPWVER